MPFTASVFVLFQNNVIALFAQFPPSSVRAIVDTFNDPIKTFALLNELYI